MILILCEYPYGFRQCVQYNGKVPDLDYGSSQNKAGFSLIQCQALGRPGIFALRNNICTQLFGSPTLFLNLNLTVPPKLYSKILED